jgi:glycine cleavage system transcriptional repressor
MSKSFYLLTAFGKDRPGMVAQLTQLIFQAKGNIEDTSMTRLGGEFAMMLIIGLPNAAAGARLLKSLPGAQKKWGLVLNAKPVSPSLAHARHRSQATHLISIYGTDQPGIVYRAAQTLAARRINITDLNTRSLQRSGKMLYVMLLEVQIPSRAKAAALQSELYRLGRSLRLDVTLQNIDSVPL